MEKDKQFTILSFVGGGIRGLMSVTILEKLYQRFPGLIEHTDLIAGCSTGSIITSELLAGKKPQQLIEFFTDPKGELGFYDAMSTDPRAPAYSIQKVYDSQFLLHGPLTVDELQRKKALFVTFNVGRLEPSSEGLMTPVPWQPVMYTNMIPGHGDVEIAKAAASSGAMPGQLGSYKGNVDGAFFNHDPTVAAISLAVRAGHKLENIVAITIGTGLMYDWIASDTGDWGAEQWMNGVADPFNSTPPFLMNQSKPGPILDMCLNGTSTELMPMLAGMLLGDRYVNINPRLPFFIPENTTYQQAIDLLQEKGRTADTARAEALIEAYWWDHLPDGPAEQVATSGAEKKGAAAATATATATASRKAGPGAGSADPLNLGPYFIQHMRGSQYVLDVDNGSTDKGTPVIGFALKPTGTENQQWRFVPAGPEAPGWWYLQTLMGTDYVMTLQPHATSGSGPIVMQPISAADQDTQLWSLQPTEVLGYWYIQSKYGASNKQAPAVVALDGDASAAPALANPISFTGFEGQAWGFKPV